MLKNHFLFMTSKQAITLNAKTRQATRKQVAELREAGQLPAVLYGKGIDNKNLVLNYIEFDHALATAGESTLIDLKIDDKEPVKILIHAFEREPVSHRLIHVDFYQVRMDEKIKTDVELIFVGESPAVKNLNGVLVKALDKIEIECLPDDLLSQIEIDISTLKTFDNIIRVKDLALPDNVDILNDLEAPIALVEEPRKIEEEAPVETETKEATVEGEEKKEGEEGDEKKDEGEEKNN